MKKTLFTIICSNYELICHNYDNLFLHQIIFCKSHTIFFQYNILVVIILFNYLCIFISHTSLLWYLLCYYIFCDCLLPQGNKDSIERIYDFAAIEGDIKPLIGNFEKVSVSRYFIYLRIFFFSRGTVYLVSSRFSGSHLFSSFY